MGVYVLLCPRLKPTHPSCIAVLADASLDKIEARVNAWLFCVCGGPRKLVPPARFQRATFRLGGGRSMQLSYGSTENRHFTDVPVRGNVTIPTSLPAIPAINENQSLTTSMTEIRLIQAERH